MKIVVLTKTIPYPPRDGSAIRNYQLLRALAAAHDISLVSIVRREEEFEGVAFLQSAGIPVYPVPLSRSMFRRAGDLCCSLLTGVPYTVLANTSERLIGELRRCIAERAPDVLLVQELYLMENLRRLTEETSIAMPVVLDLHNIEGVILERLADCASSQLARRYYQWQAGCMHRFERASLTAVAGVSVVSKLEYEYLLPRDLMLACVPNGVVRADVLPARRNGSVARLVFVGTLDYAPNRDAVQWFASEIFPLVRRAFPDAELRIVGRKPRRALTGVERDGVTQLHSVDDLPSELLQDSVLVVPLRAGAGTRLKILDAFSAGLPVVSTSVGAEGLQVRNDEHLLIRDEAEPFAEAVVELLRDPRRGATLAANAFHWSQRELRWDVSAAALEQLLAEVVFGAAPKYRVAR